MALEMQMKNRVGAMAKMDKRAPSFPIKEAKPPAPSIMTAVPAAPMMRNSPIVTL